MVGINEIVTETKSADIKYALINPKQKFYVFRYIMSNMYALGESFIIMARPQKMIIRIQGIDPCFMMNKNRK